ncbi:alpha/beta hydrolase [Phaeobacter sp. QD34_3]|uniref:alpha/beta hydrolase n=1 Tax=unclassified Phaeobacter TaxID=2621772 RepID=UPI00237F7434|nr:MULTISPECIES: alpha/beta hydrolase [unclassified Phaeobacter]MDE4132357.1 alpha/beta hydrolase [Phaeobacter sp. QD34_3]MDE4135995.1 alpha/beta hydrolase [Phaeobacter sp. QD34_24]
MKTLKLLWALVRVLLPERLVRASYGGALPVVDGRRADPKAQAVADLVSLVRDPAVQPTVEESRAQLAGFVEKFDAPCTAPVERRDITLPGADGVRPARQYIPEAIDQSRPMPCLMYLHGGGWIQGSIDTHDALCAKLAARAGVCVVAFSYRLAPEAPFPAAPQDVMAGYRALLDHAEDLGIDPARLAVGGDSAGANLTASLLHSLSEGGLPLPQAQLLIYPAVDARLTSASVQALHDHALLSRPRMEWYMDQYVPQGQDRLAPEISPLMSPCLAGQSQAFVLVAGHDPLWDDGLSYAAALEQAGVPVTVSRYPGQIHGFLNLTKVVPQGDIAISEAAQWLAFALHTDA